MRPLYVVLHDATGMLEVSVDSADGKVRRVALTQKAKDPVAVPETWWQQVVAEIEHRRVQEKKGGLL